MPLTFLLISQHYQINLCPHLRLEWSRSVPGGSSKEHLKRGQFTPVLMRELKLRAHTCPQSTLFKDSLPPPPLLTSCFPILLLLGGCRPGCQRAKG